MKINSLLMLFMFLSCAQKDKNEPVVKIESEKVAVLDASEQENTLSFDEAINSITIKSLPLVDSTNFDNIKEDNLYTKQEVLALKLQQIYPEFYQQGEGNSYKAKASYKIDFFKNFHSIVSNVISENEMKTLLVNYDLQGDIIDSKMIAYDEIAEGAFRRYSKIERNTIAITYIEWMDERKETTEVYEVDETGKINPSIINDKLYTESELIDKVIKELNIDGSKTNFVSSKVFPANPDETIIVIPELADGYNEKDEVYQLNAHIAIINNRTGAITHRFSESSKTSGWDSDALCITDIRIDTTQYEINISQPAFGIIISKRSMSQPNPYKEDIFSLFTKEKDSLKKILDYYTIYESSGIVNVNMCYSDFKIEKKSLSVNNTKTNGYYDILVTMTKINRHFREDENSECNPIEKVLSTAETSLKFNGKTYDKL